MSLSPKSHQSYWNVCNKIYLDEPQDTEFKKTVISFIKELKKFKEDRKRVIELKENKYLSDDQENTNKIDGNNEDNSGCETAFNK